MDDELKAYVKKELTRVIDAAFNAAPWWCMICGEGGNYEGERPDTYWYPPVTHICKDVNPQLEGIIE